MQRAPAHAPVEPEVEQGEDQSAGEIGGDGDAEEARAAGRQLEGGGGRSTRRHVVGADERLPHRSDVEDGDDAAIGVAWGEVRHGAGDPPIDGQPKRHAHEACPVEVRPSDQPDYEPYGKEDQRPAEHRCAQRAGAPLRRGYEPRHCPGHHREQGEHIGGKDRQPAGQLEPSVHGVGGELEGQRGEDKHTSARGRQGGQADDQGGHRHGGSDESSAARGESDTHRDVDRCAPAYRGETDPSRQIAPAALRTAVTAARWPG
jgi:hypothetical protein